MALIGPNGAGKSTVARMVTGLITATSGQIEFSGHDITRLPAFKIARMGMAHVVEGRGVFASLTVEENLLLAFRQRDRRGSPAQDLAAAPTTPSPFWGSGAASSPARSRVASSDSCRWPRSWWSRPGSWSPTSCPWAWLRWPSTRSTRASWRSTTTARH